MDGLRGNLFRRNFVPPYPFQKNSLTRIIQTDSKDTNRRAVRATKTCFGYREKSGATETLISQKVDPQMILFKKRLSAFKKVINIR